MRSPSRRGSEGEAFDVEVAARDSGSPDLPLHEVGQTGRAAEEDLALHEVGDELPQVVRGARALPGERARDLARVAPREPDRDGERGDRGQRGAAGS